MKHRKTYFNTCILLSTLLLLSGCIKKEKDCGLKDLESKHIAWGYLYKFHDGYDFSNHVLVCNDNIMLGYRPYRMHDGYYLSGAFLPYDLDLLFNQDEYRKHDFHSWYVRYLSITYDDIDSGRAPADWITHWKDYVVYPTNERGDTLVYYHTFNAQYSPLCKVEMIESSGYSFPDYDINITLHSPNYYDIHLDTNYINQLIDSQNFTELFQLWQPFFRL